MGADIWGFPSFDLLLERDVFEFMMEGWDFVGWSPLDVGRYRMAESEFW